jgi:hypothetical protein
MGRRDALIALYAEDLRTKCGIEPDMDLLEQVTLACGPLIYEPDASLVSGSDRAERERIRRNFLMRRLALDEGPELPEAIETALEIYGADEPRKYRAVVYYMLVKHFGCEETFRNVPPARI